MCLLRYHWRRGASTGGINIHFSLIVKWALVNLGFCSAAIEPWNKSKREISWHWLIKLSNPSLSLPFFPQQSCHCSENQQLRQPWWTATLSPELSCHEASQWWVRRGEGLLGGSWWLLSLACPHSEQVKEANTNLFHELRVLRQGHKLAGQHSEAHWLQRSA